MRYLAAGALAGLAIFPGVAAVHYTWNGPEPWRFLAWLLLWACFLLTRRVWDWGETL